jgi:hypothetical protein
MGVSLQLVANMMWRIAYFCFLASLATGAAATAGQPQAENRLRVFLDCDRCFEDYIREEIDFVDYVRDPAEADMHIIVTDAATAGGGREYTASFVGRAPSDAPARTLRTVTATGETDDTIRRQLANMIRIGLLNAVAGNTVPAELVVAVTSTPRPAASPVGDPWNSWVFSVRASGSFEGEESQREARTEGEGSADRITDNWKITLGVGFERVSQHFDLEDEGPVEVARHEREFQGLVVKSLGEHWSIGGEGDIRSTTFENEKLTYEMAPAVEFNLFPYSMYTRRQLRVQYAAGVRHASYYEETLTGKLQETHPVHAASVAFEKTEQWGSLDTRLEWSQYLHDRSLTRLEAEGELSWRLARGFSLSMEGNASRVRDQISLPRRGATPEEVLLELRQLRSGYEYRLEFGVTYSFGSIFSALVNPRFGQ